MRIALISDIHFGAASATSEFAIQGEPIRYGEVSSAKPFFQGLIDTLQKESPNYLFVAGDLTSTGSPLEFKYCYEKIYQLAESVNIPSENVIFSLGNHDIDWRITQPIDLYKTGSNAKYLDEDINFLEVNYIKLANHWAVNIGKNATSNAASFKHLYDGSPLTGVIEREDGIIFVLNSGHLCSHEKSRKHGCLSKHQLEWFKALLENEYVSCTKTKIVLLHHHPFNYPYPNLGRDVSTLEEGSELHEICGQFGVNLVLHGHRHHPKAKTASETGWKNPVTYICAGSLSVNATHRLQGAIPNTFHIIECKGREQIVLKNYEYSVTDGWIITQKFRKEVPLDGNMLLGKPITTDDPEIAKLIKELPTNKKIAFSSLDNDLSYIYRHLLIELIKNEFNDCEVFEQSDTDSFMIYKPTGGEA